jgi:Cdc6-like AAA superfamily ATPase
MRSQAPEPSCRDDLRKRVRTAIERIRIGRPTKSVIMVGRRGVGKTALLNLFSHEMEHSQVHCVRVDAMESRSLPSILTPALHLALLRMSTVDAAKTPAARGLRALASFSRGLKAKFADIEAGLDYEPEAGLADNGDLDGDLTALLIQIGAAAKAAGTALVIFVDEMQYIEEAQLAALISALHRLSQLALPVILVGAGLPQIRGRAGNARSYAERLFDFPEIEPLDPAELDQTS